RLQRLIRTVPEIKIDDKSLIRITMSFDALKINREALDDWLRLLRREQSGVRVSTEATLNIRLILDRSRESEAEMLQRIREMTTDLADVKVTQESPTRFTFSMDGTQPVPEALETRLGRLQRDFPNISITRDLPTKLSLTSAKSTAPPANLDVKLARTIEPYKNIQIIHRPVTPEAVKDEMQLFIADPSTRPLSDAERKDHQRRAVEALRKMAIGELQGYDVRPAVGALRAALRSDDLAPAAIDAMAALPGKNPQQDLADLTLDPARPAPIRVKAANGLTRHVQAHDSAPLSDAQIQNLIKTY